MGWPRKIVSRCICEISTSMKPKPIAAKKTRCGAAPAKVDAAIAPARGPAAEGCTRRSAAVTVTSSTPSTPTAFMLKRTMPWSRQRAVSKTSRRRSMWKKNGRVVGRRRDVRADAARRRRRARSPLAMAANVSSREMPRALHDLELQRRGHRLERVEIGGRRTDRATRASCRRRRARRAAVGRLRGRWRSDRRVGRRRAACSVVDASVASAVDLARPIGVVPARDGEHAARRQVIEEDAPGLDGVERVLGQHERAAGGRRPGVDQRDLDDVEAIVVAGR